MVYLITTIIFSLLPVSLALDAKAGCAWAEANKSKSWLSCVSSIDYPNFTDQTSPTKPPPVVTYNIRMSATGQDVQTWCMNIMGSIKTSCGNRLITPVSCSADNPGLAAVMFDPNNNWSIGRIQGMDLTFTLTYGKGSSFRGDDHDHSCMADAINMGTCDKVEISGGSVCISTGYTFPEVFQNQDIGDDSHTLLADNEYHIVSPQAIDPFITT